MLSQRFVRAGLGLLIGFGLLQLVPYGRNHTNPPVTGEPAWDSPRTAELAARACLDCHSNLTKWPWYASVAPISWRIQDHVDEGRAELNFSAMDRPQKEAREAAEAVREGEMPPRDYLLAHPEARLSPSEKAELVAGLTATFGGRTGRGGEHQDGEDDD